MKVPLLIRLLLLWVVVSLPVSWLAIAYAQGEIPEIVVFIGGWVDMLLFMAVYALVEEE